MAPGSSFAFFMRSKYRALLFQLRYTSFIISYVQGWRVQVQTLNIGALD
jgi:hypothetical protein